MEKVEINVKQKIEFYFKDVEKNSHRYYEVLNDLCDASINHDEWLYNHLQETLSIINEMIKCDRDAIKGYLMMSGLNEKLSHQLSNDNTSIRTILNNWEVNAQ